ELEELTALPAALGFRRPLAHHVFVLASLDHLTGDFGTEDHVVALAARFAVVVSQFVAAGHALQKVLVADTALPGQDFRQFQRLFSRLLVVFGGSFFERLSLLAHGLFSSPRTQNQRHGQFPWCLPHLENPGHHTLSITWNTPFTPPCGPQEALESPPL